MRAGIDLANVAAGAIFIGTIIVLPLLGYWLTYLDFMAHLRRLKGVLVRVAHATYHLPGWVVDQEVPHCLRSFGLQLPCTEDELKEAYRRRAKELHPDRGGEIRHFLKLQEEMEQATHFLRQYHERL